MKLAVWPDITTEALSAAAIRTVQSGVFNMQAALRDTPAAVSVIVIRQLLSAAHILQADWLGQTEAQLIIAIQLVLLWKHRLVARLDAA